MDKHLYLIKLKTAQIYDKQGNRLAVSYLKIPKIVVLEKKGTIGKYQIIKVGILKKDLKKCKDPQKKFFEKINSQIGFYYLREIKVSKDINLEVGQDLPVDKILSKGEFVLVSGKTKGRGFAGVMKRWGFKGGPRTHGQSDRQRAIGSIGQGTDPGRVHKGKKMPGRMGGKTETIGKLNVLKVDLNKGEIIIKGLIPGPNKGLIAISKLLTRKIKVIELWEDEKKQIKEEQDLKQKESKEEKAVGGTKEPKKEIKEKVKEKKQEEKSGGNKKE